MPPLVIRNLAKSFPARNGCGPVAAVDDLSLTIEANEFLTLVGPSGGGKTTLLRLLAGLEIPDQGEIELDQQDITRLPPEHRDVAMVFQQPALLPHLTVMENLALGLRLRQTPDHEIRSRCASAVAVLGLDGLLERRPGEISGGEAQRVSLGRALVRQPKLFLLDEPLSQLDVPTRHQLRRELGALQRHLGLPFLHVTHDQAEAMALGGRIAVLHEGRLQQVAAPVDLYRRPSNRFVATFFGMPPTNLVRGQFTSKGTATEFRESSPNSPTIRNDCLTILWSNSLPASLLNQPVDLGLRPEAIRLGSPGDGPGSARVTSVEFLGHETQVELQTAGHSITARLNHSFSGQPGQRFGLTFDLDSVLLFDAQTGRQLWPGA